MDTHTQRHAEAQTRTPTSTSTLAQMQKCVGARAQVHERACKHGAKPLGRKGMKKSKGRQWTRPIDITAQLCNDIR
eukprot:7404605-Alexandrium_andersonii.AAC.1